MNAMLDGNTAALRSYEERESFIEAVFRTHERTARIELAEEAVAKITAEQVELTDVWDELLARAEDIKSAQQAMELGQAEELGKVLIEVAARIVTRRRGQYIEDHLEERVWDLQRGPGAW